VADRDPALLDDHGDAPAPAREPQHLLELRSGVLDVAVLDGVPTRGERLTGIRGVGSAVLAVDDDALVGGHAFIIAL
jgi:hypothetical protein